MRCDAMQFFVYTNAIKRKIKHFDIEMVNFLVENAFCALELYVCVYFLPVCTYKNESARP